MAIQDGKNPPSSTGSDLDVFDDLQKKIPSAANRPRTMIGMPPAPRLPPPPGSQRSTVPPPPPPGRMKPTMPSGLSAPPPVPQRSSFPPAGVSSLPPAGVTVRPPGRMLPEVSADWDDEQEKTTVYDRSTQDAASALLRSGPSTMDVPPPPMSRPPAAPPAALRPHAPAAAQLMSPSPVAVVPARAPVPTPSRAPLYIMAAAVVVLGAVLGLLLRPAKGSLIVTVAGVGSRPIDAVEVLVDGEVSCTSSPCKISNLKAGTHLVQARAVGHTPAAEIAIVITGGQEAVHNVTLPRSGGTGIKVSALGAGLKLYVDGNEIGPLPQDLPDMTPGEHLIRVAGNDRYAPYEQRIDVQVGQMETIGPLSLRVVKGLATIQAGAGAADARITLESGNDRRTLPDALPIRLDIPTDREHTLVAVRKGYTTYREKLVFEDGAAEKVFVISLTKIGDEDSLGVPPAEPPPTRAQDPVPAREPSPTREPAPAREPVPEPKPAAAASTGTATLNINSIPRSNVLLDGRPIGQTPKIGISVSAGQHTVVFIKDDERKTATISVPEGGNKTVAVRF